MGTNIGIRLAEQLKHVVCLMAIDGRCLRAIVISNLHGIIVRHAISKFQCLFTEKVATMSADQSKVSNGSKNTSIRLSAHLVSRCDCVDLARRVLLKPIVQLALVPREFQLDDQIGA